jgi:hypothetical protein
VMQSFIIICVSDEFNQLPSYFLPFTHTHTDE